MRKPVIISFLLFFLYFSLSAQTGKQQRGWAVTLTGALVPISQPGLAIQPGAEYRFNDRLSLLAEITIPVYNKNSKDLSELNKQYLRIKSEMRYSLLSKRKKSHLYTGLQVASASRRFINQNSFYYDQKHSDSVYYYDKANISSPVTTASLQFGTIITDGRFAVDVFAGIGARFINTSISDIVNPVRGVITSEYNGPNFTASYSYKGNVTMFHLNGGVRLMWHFYQLRHPRKS